jgi:ankyrin repeat protein
MLRNYFKFALYVIAAIWFSTAKAGAYEDFFRSVAVDDATGVQQLLNRGFDPNARDEKGQVALYLALRAGSLKVADALLEHPQLQADAHNEAGETPLMMAALRGHLTAAQKLLARGSAPHQAGWGPLHYAASGPEVKLVTLLLDQGAPVDARAPNGSTPLMMATSYGPESAVQVLLARGADAKLRNTHGLNAADLARQAGRDKLAALLDAAVAR